MTKKVLDCYLRAGFRNAGQVAEFRKKYPEAARILEAAGRGTIRLPKRGRK
jgi:hypothetical protein